MMVRPIKQSRSVRRLVQTCALAVVPLLFGACTAAVPGVPATNAPIAMATPAKSAVTKPPSTKGVTTKGGAATGAVGAEAGTSTSSSTTGANTTKTGTSTSAATGTGASNAAAAGDLVMLRANGAHGSMLTDAKGMTLYVFDKDSKDMSTCSGDCLTKWPPFTAVSAAAAMKSAAGITGKLGTIKRADGKFQVTINGMPLYHYYEDEQPGDTKGQAVGDVWWLVGAEGNKISK